PAMKIALLGTGFGQAHAAVYAQRPDVGEVVVFGRTAAKLATISGQFGFATTTDLNALITDDSVDLVDICLPTRLHADVAVAAMQAGTTCSSSCRWPPRWKTPAASSPPSRPPAGRRSWTCSPGSAPPTSSCARRPPASGTGRCGCWRSRAAPRCCGPDTTSAWTPWRWT